MAGYIHEVQLSGRMTAAALQPQLTVLSHKPWKAWLALSWFWSEIDWQFSDPRIVTGLKSQVGLLQTAHSWANAGVLMGSRVRRRVAFETIKLIDANVLCTIFDIKLHQNITQINMQGASV